MAKPYNAKGLTRVEVVVLVLVGIIVLSLAPVVLRRARVNSNRTACAANLAALGKAMLVYANDYGGEFPRAGSRVTTWGEVSQWDAPDRRRAFGLAADGGGGRATISSCFYLLVKHIGVPTKHFVCPGDRGTTEFKLSEIPGLRAGFTLADAWDFGPWSHRHCSYAYHIPFGLFALKTTDEPGMAVAADHNPWIRGPDRDPKPLAGFRPDLPPFKGTPQQARAGNSVSHREEGQNVLFADGHVAFQERSYCGLDGDNIYLVSNSLQQGSPLGSVPIPPMAVPANRRDSVLVHDPPEFSPVSYLAGRVPEALQVDSRNLQQTAVVATLDCPLPEHKNAIWCSTFQIAWDRFKKDLIGEPLQLLGAEELAGRLNHAEYPAGDIEAKSYYATAGFVKRGIIEQIQKDMARRFPSEPVPVFGREYRALPDVVVAYAYLNVDVGFQDPYYANLGTFNFADSAGARTGVTAFCAQTSVQDGSYARVREQVEVLHYDYGQSPEAVQFAVDLCKHTQPYQVILARVPRGRTLGEAAQALQSKIAEFKSDEDYEILRKLRPIDTLIVPDVLFKLTHHFSELLGKYFGNEQWQSHFIFEALQKIDFSLSRTGVVVKSEARLSAAAGRSAPQLAQPRRLHFDRPFLICVRKREPNATPFFLMWVDNAELMQQYGTGEGR
ncbi:MAG: hypothetical protein FJ280_16045 [Planctomycetes bacterium]|nr:hypothetical protein [Planctomycetota bacterium]